MNSNEQTIANLAETVGAVEALLAIGHYDDEKRPVMEETVAVVRQNLRDLGVSL